VPPRVEVIVSAATVVKALALALGILLVIIARDAVLSVLLATVLVLGLDPPVSALERRGLGRGKAALLVFGAIGLAVTVIVVWAVAPVWNEARDFVGNLPGYVDEIRDSPALKQLDENSQALENLRQAFADAAQTLPDAAIGLLGAVGSAFSGVLTLATLLFLTLFGLIGKPALTQAALELFPPKTADRVDHTIDEVSRTMSSALIGNVVISVIAGVVVGVSAWLVGAPSPVVLALIVGLFDLIPQVGSAVAAVIVTLVTLVAGGPAAAAVMLLVILVYQQVENYLIQPAVMRQAVELSPFATIACVLVGSALLGVVGAILAVPVAAGAKVVFRSATADRRARMATLREPGPGIDGRPKSALGN
jgi:predicted PurR-regulated permease PerM